MGKYKIKTQLVVDRLCKLIIIFHDNYGFAVATFVILNHFGIINTKPERIITSASQLALTAQGIFQLLRTCFEVKAINIRKRYFIIVKY
jgi:hypothetical protein